MDDFRTPLSNPKVLTFEDVETALIRSLMPEVLIKKGLYKAQYRKKIVCVNNHKVISVNEYNNLIKTRILKAIKELK